MSPKQEEKRGFDIEAELEMQEMGRSGEVRSETPMKLAQRSMCEARGRGLRLSPTACGKLFRVRLPYTGAQAPAEVSVETPHWVISCGFWMSGKGNLLPKVSQTQGSGQTPFAIFATSCRHLWSPEASSPGGSWMMNGSEGLWLVTRVARVPGCSSVSAVHLGRPRARPRGRWICEVFV